MLKKDGFNICPRKMAFPGPTVSNLLRLELLVVPISNTFITCIQPVLMRIITLLLPLAGLLYFTRPKVAWSEYTSKMKLRLSRVGLSKRRVSVTLNSTPGARFTSLAAVWVRKTSLLMVTLLTTLTWLPPAIRTVSLVPRTSTPTQVEAAFQFPPGAWLVIMAALETHPRN